MAVVFRREKDRRVYVGTVSDPAPPARTEETALIQRDKGGLGTSAQAPEYEICLVRDGETRELWYSPGRRVWGEVSEGGKGEREHRDDGALARILRDAHPAAAGPPKRIYAEGESCGPLVSHSLEHLCRRSEVIIVGRVVGILRNAYTPIGHAGVSQHTVYVVGVEQSLKTDARGTRPLIKVWISGGWLPRVWLDGRPIGMGVEHPDDPLLGVGERYVLFLLRPEDVGGRHHRLGFVPGWANGRRGKVAELDEYIVTYPWGGKLLLQNGITRAPRLSGRAQDHWRFQEGPQILDLPEPLSLQIIREEIAQLREP